MHDYAGPKASLPRLEDGHSPPRYTAHSIDAPISRMLP
jgi:hypothetical protein